MYSATCPACRDELTVGWVPDGLGALPAQKDPARRKVPATDGQGMTHAPQVCGCGGVTLRLHGAAQRAVVEWTTAAEPVVSSSMTHGSLRDRAR